MNIMDFLSKVFGNRVYTVRANDGGLYSERQYEEAVQLLVRSGYNSFFEYSRLYVVGSITVFDADRAVASFYMRDLVRGVVRDNDEARTEYQESVRQAGLAGE